jgi:DNA-binding transcriptional LysR family regulator
MTSDFIHMIPAARESGRDPWLGMELRHLAALAAVAREGSFRAAADQLGYVPSALSQQVAHLERVVGQQLIVRTPGRLPLGFTPAGDMLLAHAERILSRLSAAQDELEKLSAGGSSRLRVGACASVAAGMLPRVLPDVLVALPGVRLEVVEDTGLELATRVARGTLDAAFVEMPAPEGPFAFADLGSDDYLLLAPADQSPRLHRIPDLAELALIDHALMGPVEERLRGLGVAPEYALRCHSDAALRTLIARQAGYAIVPGLSHVENPAEGIEAVSLRELIPPRRVCLLWREERGLSDEVARLVELATRVSDLPARPQIAAVEPPVNGSATARR